MAKSKRSTGSKGIEKSPVIGWREWVSLPELGIPGIKAKIDTGARTSALHAYRIRPVELHGRLWVEFFLHPIQRQKEPEVFCRAAVRDLRDITSSNAARETRYVIETRARFGPIERTIQLTLTNRDEMGFRMLLGREALRGVCLIDPKRSYTGGKFRVKDMYPETHHAKRENHR